MYSPARRRCSPSPWYIAPYGHVPRTWLEPLTTDCATPARTHPSPEELIDLTEDVDMDSLAPAVPSQASPAAHATIAAVQDSPSTPTRARTTTKAQTGKGKKGVLKKKNPQAQVNPLIIVTLRLIMNCV